ncbi:MAG: hypothetical protein P8L32_00195 [Paracoccaceae bacterium]|nr:hypothetical protein [Paracoccaceae bacterium]
MNRTIPMLAIGLIFGTLVGFLIAAGYGVTLDGHDHETAHADTSLAEAETASHDHSEVITLDAAMAPTIEAILHVDPAGGWNLEVVVQNFRFAPEHVSQDHIAGEGHAHVYVNGAKIARLYGNWFQLAGVKSGDAVSISLNSNDHKAFAVNNRAISTQVTIP